MKFTTTLILLGILITVNGFAQSPADPAPAPQSGDAPVFLDNHRPLNPKKEKNPTTRTVTGTVVDDGQPLEGAMVTLVDGKTKEKFEYFTKKDGKYRFEDLSFSVDYQLRAKWRNLASDERKLSQYDHTARIVRQLEVTTPEGAPPPSASDAKANTPKP